MPVRHIQVKKELEGVMRCSIEFRGKLRRRQPGRLPALAPGAGPRRISGDRRRLVGLPAQGLAARIPMPPQGRRKASPIESALRWS